MARHNGLSFYKRRKKISASLVREIFSWIFGIILTVFLALVIDYYFGMTTSVVGVSMEPALYNGQKVLVNRLSYVLFNPKKGDVIVFLPNGNEKSHYYIKRVVATAGDKVRITDGILYVNDVKSDIVTEKILDAGIAVNEFVLENGEYFCLGDDTGNSEDSRSANIGPVKETDIIGSVWFKFKCESDKMGFVK
jgi:signal peptidase I